MKKLGILGGMGPLATNYMYHKLITEVKATKDQDHIDMVILNNPKIPDRTAYILDNTKENPLQPLIDGCKTLELCGCDLIAIPCNTSHYFFDGLTKAISTPIINMIDLTVERLLHDKVSTVSLLATKGTIISGVYTHKLDKAGIKVNILNDNDINRIMNVIYGIKADPSKVDYKDYYNLVDEQLDISERVILGCTELSLLNKRSNPKLIDPLDLVVEYVIARHEKVQAKAQKEFEFNS